MTILGAIQGSVLGNKASASRHGDLRLKAMAIYFPASKFAVESDPDHEGYVPENTLYPVEFAQRQGWATFLQAFLGRVPS